MNAFDLLLDQWTHQVKELFPQLHAYQQQSLAFCVQGLLRSGNAVMQRVAEEVWEHSDSPTKMVSHERRLQRFVANERIDVDACWDDFLRQVLPFWQDRTVTLILDMSPYTDEMTITYVGLLVRGRVLPLCWCLQPQQESWDRGQWDLVADLFGRIAPWLSSERCTLIADRGLSCLELIRLCKKVGWHYLLRIKQDEQFRRKFRHWYHDWQSGKEVIRKAGDQWYGKVLLWQEHAYETWLSACWEVGYEEPWLLISDRHASHRRVSEYARRMSVEATFQDQKSRGCLIECSRFSNRDHLHRWLFVVFVALWWSAHLGGSCIHNGYREQVDRKDRRDKGVLRIGRLWLIAILKKANRALVAGEHPSRIAVQLARCLLFSPRQKRLFFSICLQ
jgi:Transposase DDE domain